MRRLLANAVQFDLFQIPTAVEPTAGALSWDAQLRAALSQVLKETPHSRDIVAARMSELLGEPVTKARLDSWTAESKDGHRFPLAYLLAFEVACETHAITQLLVAKRGCVLLVGKEALLGELGRLDKAEADIKAKRRRLKAQMAGGEP